MNKREQILKKLQNPDDRVLIAKVLDKAELAERAGKLIHTDFLDPYQQSLVERYLSGNEQFEYVIDGGYHGAERAVAFFCPPFVSPEEETLRQVFRLVEVMPTTREVLSHRDYLGSLMSLGLKREKTGDILVDSENCHMVVFEEIADYIRYNLVKVGSARVEVEVKEVTELRSPEPKTKEISVTVASLRLDCIAGPGFGMSRSKAAEFIKAGKLNLNWVAVEDPGKTVKEGDTLTIRGRGRVVVEQVGNRTKRDRIGVVLRKFL